MLNFSYYNPTRISMGKGAETETGVYLKTLGKKALLHYGGGSVKKNGVYDRVTASLRENGVEFVELGGVQPNPRLSLVREGIALCRGQGVDCILAAGGGSVIDSSKAIAAGLKYDGDVWDFYCGKATIKAAAPLGVVLTIPAAGSETSEVSVITNEDGSYKRSTRGPAIIPSFAVINPETNFTLPPYQTACGSSDMLAHLMERYFTNVTGVDLSDRLLEGAMRTVLHYAPLAIAQPEDYDIRAELCWTGTLAHNALFDRGRLGDWASHNIEHELSARYDIAHGAGLSIVFPAWMKYVYKENIPRFMQFAVRVMGVDYAYDQTDRTILGAISRLEAFYRSLSLPVRISDLGIGDEHLLDMANKTICGPSGTRGNFKVLANDDVYQILRLAL